MHDFNIRDYGAPPDATVSATQAIQKTIDACHAAGGGRVVVPAGGRYRIGSLVLKTGVELHVEDDAVLTVSTNPGDMTEKALPGREMTACIVAREADHIAITGRGVIDGQGAACMQVRGRYIDKARPGMVSMLVSLIRCRNVVVRDITFRDSPGWTLHPADCENVAIERIRIENDWKIPHSDGIDPNHCRNVRIAHCHIVGGDDAIVLKNRKELPDAGPTENVVIADCTLISTSAAFKIGTESVDDFRHIEVRNCRIQTSNRGLAIQLRDEGNVEDVLFEDCTVESRFFAPDWWGSAEPIYVTAIHRAPGTGLGCVRNVRFRNVRCRSENSVFVAGSEDARIEDLLFEGVRVEIDKWSKWPGGRQDRRPCMSPHTNFAIEPEKDVGLTEHSTPGFFIEFARGVVLRDTAVKWGPNPQPYWGHALETRRVEDLQIERFEGKAGREGLPAIADAGKEGAARDYDG